jgi:hypothetical protein
MSTIGSAALIRQVGLAYLVAALPFDANYNHTLTSWNTIKAQ